MDGKVCSCGFFYSQCFQFIDVQIVPIQMSSSPWVTPWCAPSASMARLLLLPQWGGCCCDHRRLQVIDHEARIEQAQLYILCQVQRLLITLLLTLYHIGQCLTDGGICLFGIYLPLWHKSNMIL